MTVRAGWQAGRQAARRTSLALLTTSGLIAGIATPAAAQISRVSTTSANTEANGPSSSVDISGDGRFVAFVSSATNLVANDTNGSPDVFVKNLQTGAVTRVSVRTDGSEAVGDVWMPELSNDGRYVSFLTKKALVPEDTSADCGAPPCGDVYVHDREIGRTMRESVAFDGAQASAGIDSARLSGNGRFVLFATQATNITPDAGTNGVQLFLRDRLIRATTRVPFPGASAALRVSRAAISDDGRVIVFGMSSANTDVTGDTVPCADRTRCGRVYVHAKAIGLTTRLEPALGEDRRLTDLQLGDFSGNGRYVLIFARDPLQAWNTRGTVYDFATASNDPSERVNWSESDRPILSGDGRSIVSCDVRPFGAMSIRDRLWRVSDTLVDPLEAGCGGHLAISADSGRIVWNSALGTIVPNDTNGVADIFVFDADQDRDGVPSRWEERLGMSPNGSDAAGDSDGDGVTNLREYQAGTHPNGTVRRYFAEGALNAFFDYRVNLFSDQPGRSVHATYIGANGKVVSQMFRNTPSSIDVHYTSSGERMLGDRTLGDRAAPVSMPDATFSVLLESSAPFAAERTMMWGGASYIQRHGATTQRAMTAPSTRWYFGEGATGPYNLYYQLQNPGDAPATVRIHYLLPAPQAPIVLDYAVAPHSRKTIDVNAEPGLANAEVSARIVSDVPILAERTMYFSIATQVYAGGHVGAGIAAPASEWFVAEGATGFFRTYLTIANPSEQAADLLVSYLLDDGTRIDVPHVANAESRLSIDVAGEDPRLAATTMSVIVTSRNDVPVVVERVSYWPSHAPIESSLTAGSTVRGRRWAVASAPASPNHQVDTYLLVANPTAEAGSISIALSGLDLYQTTRCQGTYELQPHSRLTVSVRDLCKLWRTDTEIDFSGTVDSSGPAIVVERSTYWTRLGPFWGIGDSAALTRLPDVP